MLNSDIKNLFFCLYSYIMSHVQAHNVMHLGDFVKWVLPELCEWPTWTRGRAWHGNDLRKLFLMEQSQKLSDVKIF